MDNLCAEIGYVSLNKYGEQLCGDHVEVITKEDMTLAVLADGLGSGVKANILSTLTATIISTLMAGGLAVEECVSAIAATLPICKVRKIAYSTFSILRVIENQEAEIIQYDNPQVIMLREGKNFEYPRTAEVIDGKTIYKSRIKLCAEDTFLLISDGVVHAGIKKELNFDWQRSDVIQFVEVVCDSKQYTAKTISAMLLEQCNLLYGGKPSDDTTVCTVKVRRRTPVNLMIGPPANPADVDGMMALFFSQEGKHIVCGGTTSMLAADFLGKPLLAGELTGMEEDIPPLSKIIGVDLVTEGVLTINRVLEYARDYADENKRYNDWEKKQDGASRIARMLFEEATDINFFVGKAINTAHQNLGLSIGFNIKMKLVEELVEILNKLGKRINISYF